MAQSRNNLGAAANKCYDFTDTGKDSLQSDFFGLHGPSMLDVINHPERIGVL